MDAEPLGSSVGATHKCVRHGGRYLNVCPGMYSRSECRCTLLAADCGKCHHSTHFANRQLPPTRRGGRDVRALARLANQCALDVIGPASPFDPLDPFAASRTRRHKWLQRIHDNCGADALMAYDQLRQQQPWLPAPPCPEIGRRAWDKAAKAYTNGLRDTGLVP